MLRVLKTSYAEEFRNLPGACKDKGIPGSQNSTYQGTVYETIKLA